MGYKTQSNRNGNSRVRSNRTKNSEGQRPKYKNGNPFGHGWRRNCRRGIGVVVFFRVDDPYLLGRFWAAMDVIRSGQGQKEQAF